MKPLKNPYKTPTMVVAGMVVITSAMLTFHKTSTAEIGPPGVAMQTTESNVRLNEKFEANALPLSLPPASPGGRLAVDEYKNVQVLGHLTSAELTRLMTTFTIWVAPKQGCGYCHAPQKDAQGNVVLNEDGYPQADTNTMYLDDLYTKRVARRMIQMTMHVNADWQQHVAKTGVTCWTCHRGNPVPSNIWFEVPDAKSDNGALGYRAHQNAPNPNANLSDLPNDALQVFLSGNAEIRVQSGSALDSNNPASIKQAEWTYSLMTYFSQSLGVNCTYCHNSRQWSDWSQSPVQRQTAWFGIRMVRDLNNNYLEPLKSTFPENRLGQLGDSPKLACATCHQGAYKPLLGKSMLAEYAVLAEPKPQPAKTPVVEAAPAMADDGGVAAAADGGAAPLATDAGVKAAADAGTPAPATDAGAAAPKK